MKKSVRVNELRTSKLSFEKLNIFLFFYAFFIMLFFTQTSPFFVLSEWVDSNAFFTVGKGMANGLVPYKDLFEQKGPLLYGLHALAYLFSHSTFYGVYILESLAMFVNLILAFKISRLYLNWMPSAIISIFFPILILNQHAFRFGDSAEEFSIPFLMTLLYIIFKYFKYDSDSLFKRSIFLLNGIMIGCVFWIKFTLVGPWIGFYLAILFICIGNKRWKDLLNAIIYTFVGLVLASIPWVIYFGMNHAIKDLIDVYFKFNLGTYSEQVGITEKLINFAFTFGDAFNDNFESRMMIIIGLIDFMFTWKYYKDKSQKWLFLSTVVFLIVGVYIGGKGYPYYFLIITPLGLFGLIAIGHFIQNANIQSRINRFNNSKWFALLAMAITTIFLCFSYNFNMKSSKFYQKEPLAQETFAKIMHQEPNPTLLNYGSLDGGFYLTANIVPNIRYFERQNVNYDIYPENMDEQNRYIKEKKIKFVVLRVDPATDVDQVNVPYLNENYRLVAQQEQYVERVPTKFLLYKEKSL
ncbi:hypothetical protein [Neobacillus massiliamazoniensis]|uniref:Glycosyltransferase RgtA/B/C/D-like domain-containing protein n=1 Tax=Neobacillus massiliamazoniensis TaxID=1499688 RepID=A0A0U1NVX7_9BACI|nr:hypothetical protein [Neobacillus massiliamazoniensis]CRK82169.1 hypothetical protein BN000_02090 [Neobacillus massiliamazoniensis]